MGTDSVAPRFAIIEIVPLIPSLLHPVCLSRILEAHPGGQAENIG
jgi:hypothetical protein